MRYEIVSIDSLRPLEKVFPIHLKNLSSMILSDGYIKKSIIADKETGTVLDGSHRYVFLLKYGFTKAPVTWVNYFNDSVRLGTRLKHRFMVEDTPKLTKEECIERALKGDLLPPRTTRHFFTFRKQDISVSLEDLKDNIQSYDALGNVTDLIANVDVSEELNNNIAYLQEISEETEVIVQYLSEIWETKRYLSDQVSMMDNLREVVFFPGKFHPPHLGHLQTIMSLIPKYRKVIIGVSEDIPRDKKVVSPENVVTVLTAFFKSFKNVEVVKIHGVLTELKNTLGLPFFDVLASGNKKVLDWAANMGVKARYLPRSEGTFFSSTEIRKEI